MAFFFNKKQEQEFLEEMRPLLAKIDKIAYWVEVDYTVGDKFTIICEGLGNAYCSYNYSNMHALLEDMYRDLDEYSERYMDLPGYEFSDWGEFEPLRELSTRADIMAKFYSENTELVDKMF